MVGRSCARLVVSMVLMGSEASRPRRLPPHPARLRRLEQASLVLIPRHQPFPRRTLEQAWASLKVEGED